MTHGSFQLQNSRQARNSVSAQALQLESSTQTLEGHSDKDLICCTVCTWAQRFRHKKYCLV